ncbi:MAG: CARDB domain-containing protein, partial [Longimicrobiales bacterium]
LQLAAVTGVRVLQGGQRVSGLTGVLKGPAQNFAGGISRLIVDLIAAQTVAAGTYQLELVAGTQGVAAPVPITVLNSLPQRVNQPTGIPSQPPTVAGTIVLPAPSVTGASPTTVTIRSGGPAQTVVLNGSLLNQLVGAYAQRNGNRVLTGISTQLLASTDPARREIRVSAHGTTGPWGEPLDLVLEYTIGSTPMKAANPLATPVKITASAPPNVDLVVSSCTFELKQNTVVTRATIRNNGTGATAFQTNQYLAQVASSHSPGQSRQFAAPGGGQTIPAGGTVEFQETYALPTTAGLMEATWTVDPRDVVAESNADNNERKCSVMIVPDVKDFSITAVSTQPSNGSAQTKFVFSVSVKNGSTSATNSSQFVEVECLIDGSRFDYNYFSATLAPNATFTKNIYTTGGFAPGSHVLECTADPKMQLNESTRSNNARSLVFNVSNQ